jgi:hypothetical protein
MASLAALALTLTLGGCSSPTTGALFRPDGGHVPTGVNATVALTWNVWPGNNTTCGSFDDTLTIGNPEASPVVTASSGSSYNGRSVSVSCSVSANAAGYAITADILYGTEGSLSFSGQTNGTLTSQPGIHGTFVDSVRSGVSASLSESDCTITFTAGSYMGAAAGRIGGTIDCPRATASDGTVCEGKAEFVLQNCGQ